VSGRGEPTIDVEIDGELTGVPSASMLRDWVRCAVSAAAELAGDVEIAVRVVDAATMQALNRDYRDRDRPTNVLSFPAGPIEGLPASESRPLGDIVLCAPVIAGEAADQGKRPADHWAHMLVHGALHLAGYDHIEAGDAARMEALETRILAQQGVADPYRVP